MSTLNSIQTVPDDSTLGGSLSKTVPKDREGDPHHQGLSTTNDDVRNLITNNVPKDDDNNTLLSKTKTSYGRQQMNSDDTCLEGEILLETFVDEQILKAGIVTTGSETPRTLHRMSQNSHILNAGRELRRMADTFEQSYERQQVKKHANEIGLGIQNYAEFRKLLATLFNPGGITHGRIIVLFFFCSDVAIRSLKKGFDLFKRFMHWSFQYFAEHVCDWVRRNGGWVAVLSPRNMYPSPTFAAFAAVTVIVCAVVYRYIRN